MDWNNPWVVGVGTGIVSGALVGWFTHVILERGENKEYRQRIEAANRDILYAIRPGITEGEIPTRDVLRALIAATARQYHVSESDLFAPPELAEELIKQVMDSSFLSSRQKSEYCNGLAPLRQLSNIEIPIARADHFAWDDTLAAYRERVIRFLSIVLGLVTSLMTVFLSLVSLREKATEVSLVNRRLEALLLPILFSTAALSLAIAIFYRLKRRKQHEAAEDILDEMKKPWKGLGKPS